MRRALKNQVGGAVPRTNQGIREDIKQRIASGQFNLGIPVLDNEYTKVLLTSEGDIQKKVCKVSARKYPLKVVDTRKSAKQVIFPKEIFLRPTNPHDISILVLWAFISLFLKSTPQNLMNLKGDPKFIFC